jgi:hypothetical protein
MYLGGVFVSMIRSGCPGLSTFHMQISPAGGLGGCCARKVAAKKLTDCGLNNTLATDRMHVIAD